MSDDIGQSIMAFSHVDVVVVDVNWIFWIENHVGTIIDFKFED